MKIFGSIFEIVSAVFRKDTKQITLEPNQSTTYTADRIVQFPPGDTAHSLVSATSTQTLTNKTLTSPAITTPTGIVKGDVGLGNVDNTSDATKNSAAVTLTNKTISGAANTLSNIPAGTALTGQVPTANGGTGQNSTATFPTSGVVVTEAASETLTNKTLSGASNTFTNIPAATAITGQLPTANGGTGQNSTATFPTSGVVVTEAATETLTNKTISGASNTISNIAAGTSLTGQVPTANGGTGQNSTATFPTSGVVVTEAATETLTNKSLTGAVITDFENYTSQGSDPSTPGNAGDVRLYSKSKFLYTKDSDGVVTQVGSGSGGRNYLSQDFFGNSVGTVGSANVTDTGNRSTGTMTAWQSTNTANISISSSSSTPLRETGSFLTTGSSSNASGTTFIESKGFNLDNVDLGKPVSIVFDISGSTTAADWDICVVRYNSSGTFQEKISVAGTASTGTPATALLPTGTTTFRGFFIANSTQSDYYAVRWRRLANSVNIKFDSLQVGPFSYQVGFAGTDTVLDSGFTPNNFGTVSAQKIYQRRAGDTMIVSGVFTAGTTAAGTASISLPSGIVFDPSKGPTQSNAYKVGQWVRLASASVVLYSTASRVGDIFYDGSDTAKLYFADAAASLAYTKTNANNLIATGDVVEVQFSVPVTSWSSNVTLADRAVEEYAYNTATADSSDTTSFGNGAGGVAFGSFTASRTKRCRFTTPILPTDRIMFEYTPDSGVTWLGGDVAYASDLQIYSQQNTTTYGVYVANVNSTDIDVVFGTYRTASGSTFSAAGSAWSGLTSKKWRVRKVSGGAAVGYPIQSSNIVGRIDAVTQPSGYIGETISVTGSASVAANSLVEVFNTSIPAGNWLLWASAGANLANNTFNKMYVILTETAAGSYSESTANVAQDGVLLSGASLGNAGFSAATPPRIVRYSVATTIRLLVETDTSAGSTASTFSGIIRGVRIA